MTSVMPLADDETTDVQDTLADSATTDVTETDAVVDADADAVDEGEVPDDANAEDTPPAAEAVVVEPVATPFRFKHTRTEDGSKRPHRPVETELPGLLWDAQRKTLTVQDDASLQRLNQLLAQGRNYELGERQEAERWKNESRQLRQQVEQTKADQSADQVAAAEYLAAVNELMGLDPEQLYAWCMEAKTNWPLLQARAERKYAEYLHTQARQPQAMPDVDIDTVVERMQVEVSTVVDQYLKEQPWASPDVIEKLTERLTDRQTMNRYAARANQDLPDIGAKKGQWLIDWDVVNQIADEFTQPYRGAHEKYAAQQQAAATKVQQTQTIAAQNAKVLAQVKPAAKPAPAPLRTARAPGEAPLSDAEVRAKIDRDMERIERETFRKR